jgi:hypothetical protein
MSYQAYIDNIRAKTGKTPEDFIKLAAQNRLTKHGEIVSWLKSNFALGHGHATAMAGVVLKAGAPKASKEESLSALFSGKKAGWRESRDKLIAQMRKFGPEVTIAAGGSLLKATKKFGIVQPSAADRLDIGIKLKGKNPVGRFEAAGAWNAMVTHRIRIHDPKQIDAEVLSWLRNAYNAA